MATILVMNGRNEGEWYTLSPVRALVFGRDDSLLAEILDPCVSRRHLEVRYEDVTECFYAIDSGSRNGIAINGERVDRFQRLCDGDCIALGHTLLVYTDTDFDDGTAAAAYLEEAQLRHAQALAEMDDKMHGDAPRGGASLVS